MAFADLRLCCAPHISGVGVQWSADRRGAWRLEDGEGAHDPACAISLEDSIAIVTDLDLGGAAAIPPVGMCLDIMANPDASGQTADGGGSSGEASVEVQRVRLALADWLSVATPRGGDGSFAVRRRTRSRNPSFNLEERKPEPPAARYYTPHIQPSFGR